MLTIKNLTVSYGGREVVSNVSLSVEKGEVLSIVGESGSGKSTILKAIMKGLGKGGTIKADQILLDGESLIDISSEEMAKKRGKEISMVFQDTAYTLNPVRKIGMQFIEYVMSHKKMTKEEAKGLAIEYFTKVQLNDPEKIFTSYPHELSGGMRQRVGLAFAIALDCKLLLADEPTSALDVTTQATIVKLLCDIAKERNIAMILVTHNLGVARYMGSKIMVMKDGRVVDEGISDVLVENPSSHYTQILMDAMPHLR